MIVEHNRLRLIFLTLSITIGLLHADGTSKRPPCRDFAGDLSNCQRFIRCFHNLRVIFSCPSGTAYVPELQTCVARELVIDCEDSKNREEVIITSNDDQDHTDDYPTIEADLNALEAPMQKSLSSDLGPRPSPRQFGCSSYCYNQGVCVLEGQKITCRCPPGFLGVRCQVAQAALSVKSCPAPNPCENGGVCVPTVFSFTCTCPPEWTDDLCTTLVPSPTNPTVTVPGTLILGTCPASIGNPCLNGGACFLVTGGGFICNCTSNSTGLRCENSVGGTTGSGSGTLLCSGNPCIDNTLSLQNQCQRNPCLNGGSCYLTATGFACACVVGYNGTTCQTNIAATNPCYNNPCRNSGTCQVAAPYTYRCVCPIGYLGVTCEQRVCDPNPCLYGGVCLPYGNSFQCSCPAQYTGTCCELLVVTTAAPNPCSSQPCLNGGTCTATSATAYVCSCTPSYYGRCCELRNYCQPNPCYNGGTCVATYNGYLCQCTFPNSGSNCEIIIPTVAPRPTCACIICPCPLPTTNVINPCLPNPCQNNGGCAVVQNTPQCYCQPTYAGSHCQYPRKRLLTNTLCANVTCLNGGECFANENGPQCSCPSPYFGQRCEIKNRPRTCDPNPCGSYGKCISTDEGHKCVCDHGRTGILCEQKMMPKDYRWCPLDCRSGTTCVYEGNVPKCRVISVY